MKTPVDDGAMTEAAMIGETYVLAVMVVCVNENEYLFYRRRVFEEEDPICLLKHIVRKKVHRSSGNESAGCL